MSLNLGSLLANSARHYGDQTALICGAETYTYDQLDAAVRRLAHHMTSAGLEPGDKVALMSPNGPEFTIAYFASLYAGCVVVTLNTLLAAREVAFQLENSEARLMFLHSECAAAGLAGLQQAEGCTSLIWAGDPSEPAAPDHATPFARAMEAGEHADVTQTGPDDTAVIIYTSGTTGQPKGAELTHFNLYYNAQYISERAFSVWPEKIHVLGPGHVGLAALPLYHIFGQTNVQNGMLFNGGATSYLSRFAPEEAVRAIERDSVTFFPGVPTMYFAILHEPACQEADLSSLRFCVSGGAPMPAEVKRQFEKQFNVRIQEGYGLTETSPLATIQTPEETDKCGTIGKPVPGVEVRIVDDKDLDVPVGERGEIVIRGHNVMKGYYKNPEATATALRGGWFHSGDIGYVDPDGHVVIVDRKKDMILRGGYNVYPREVEEVLYTHPAVREAAVIGVPDDRSGEEVLAVVSLKPGATATEDQIIAHCKAELAAYKYPRIVNIIDDLPKGSTGKILKRALRE